MEPDQGQPPQEAVEELLTPHESPAADGEADDSPLPGVPAPEDGEPVSETVGEPAGERAVEPDTGSEPPVDTPVEPMTEPTAEPAAEPAIDPTVDPDADPAVEPSAEPDTEPDPLPMEFSDVELRAILEAVIYITDEPLEAKQMALALQQPLPRVEAALADLVEQFSRPERGLQIREIAGGFKMATKPEHHEAVRQFVKNLKPSFKLTPAALETLAVIAYKQPITAPEIMEIRGVQGAGVLKTLVDRKLITTAGRKNVIGKPILYKTTRDFLVHFGLKSVNELPTLKEFEELRRLAFSEDEVVEESQPPAAPEAEEPPPADTAAEA